MLIIKTCRFNNFLIVFAFSLWNHDLGIVASLEKQIDISKKAASISPNYNVIASF